jgi:hypothetical protein
VKAARTLEEVWPSTVRGPAPKPLSFRAFCEDVCGLQLSPLMGAIVDASEGTQTLLEADLCKRHFGSMPPVRKPRTVAVRAGGRAGKTSRLLAPKALHAAWTVPLPTLGHGEEAVALLVAPDMKLGKQCLSFVSGYVDQSPMLSAARVKDDTAETCTLRRPDGRIVRVEVLAATRGGRAVRARTLVFAGLDEAAFFYAEGTGVVNDQDIYNAVAQRVVPGGQVWIVSTPWLAGIGILEKTLASEWGVHRGALVASAGTRALNPTWDPTGEIERDLRERDPDAARREIDGEPLAGTASSFFDPASIDAAVDPTLVLPRTAQAGEELCAGGDFGFRQDSSAVCVSHRSGSLLILGDLCEMRPESQPLKPSAVVRTFAERLSTHAGLTGLMADGHYRETVTEHLDEYGLDFYPAPQGNDGVSQVYMRARGLFREGRVRIPKHPRLIQQLKSVQWRPNSGGSVSIILPRTPGSGHCDLVSAFVLSLWELGGLEVEAPAPEPNTPAWYAAQEAKLLADMEASHERRMRERDGEVWG